MGNPPEIEKFITFYDRVAAGSVDYATTIHKFGRNASVGTTFEDLWTPGGTREWMTAANNLTVVSTSANDTADGTGARSIVIEGLDSDFNQISETVTMQGLTDVLTTNQFIRVNRAYVHDAGTYASTTTGSNLGTINIYDGGTAGTIQAQIALQDSVGNGQTEQVHYTVPAGHTAYIYDFILETNVDNKEVSYLFLWRPGADMVAAPFRGRRNVLSFQNVTSAEIRKTFHQPVRFPEKSDIWVAAKTSTATASFAVDYEIMISSNT